MDKLSNSFRQGVRQDGEWLFQLFRRTMRAYIDKTWGWDELLQKQGFYESLPAHEFKILLLENKDVGAYHLDCKDDHFFLNMIFLEPHFQKQGHGKLMINSLKQLAKDSKVPLKLSVLKTNPSSNFYEHLGFQAVGDDEHSLHYVWSDATINELPELR